MHEKDLCKLTKPELQALCQEEGLKKTGRKDELVSRLLGKETRKKDEPKQLPIRKDAIEHGHEEIERARLEQKRAILLAKTNDELYDILKARGLKVGGNKETRIHRLLGLEAKAKLKKIESSTVARLLMKDIFEGNDLQDNTNDPLEAEALYYFRAPYQRYPLNEFEALLSKLRARHERSRKEAAIDDELVLRQLDAIGGFAKYDVNGVESWITHPASKLLKEDLANNEHLNRTPNELRLSRPEYWGLSKAYFRKKMEQQLLTIKQNNWNNRLKDLEEDDSWADDISEWSQDDSVDPDLPRENQN